MIYASFNATTFGFLVLACLFLHMKMPPPKSFIRVECDSGGMASVSSRIGRTNKAIAPAASDSNRARHAALGRCTYGAIWGPICPT